MVELMKKIDRYLLIKEKYDLINSPLEKEENDFGVLIEIIKKSNDRDSIISKLDEETQKEVFKLIDGGII